MLGEHEMSFLCVQCNAYFVYSAQFLGCTADRFGRLDGFLPTTGDLAKIEAVANRLAPRRPIWLIFASMVVAYADQFDQRYLIILGRSILERHIWFIQEQYIIDLNNALELIGLLVSIRNHKAQQVQDLHKKCLSKDQIEVIILSLQILCALQGLELGIDRFDMQTLKLAEKAINGVGVEMQKANSSSVCKCIPYKRSIEDQFGSLNLICIWKISKGWISIDTHGEEEEGEEKEINGVGVEMQKANPSIVCKCIPYKRSIEDQFGSLNPTCVWKISEELSKTYAIDVGRKKMQLSSWEAAIEFHTRKRDIFTDIPIPQDKDRW
ncbi:hypothetical protein ACS0TY_004903 [Phlomoides rotata]